MQVLIDSATRRVLASGDHLFADSGQEIVELTALQAAKLSQAGGKTLGQNGQIAVTPPAGPVGPPANPTFDAAVAALKGMASGGPNAAMARAILDLHGIA